MVTSTLFSMPESEEVSSTFPKMSEPVVKTARVIIKIVAKVTQLFRHKLTIPAIVTRFNLSQVID